ncbi:hypothetical protein EGH73_02150 [Epilithonimonas hominis]|uniref:Uncharacterized protein n=1 Tax=Epilithonimonas hominis TaxID=420404 RepID=A0A3N0XB85_9FLAO|nr:hypothetical protein EGH73_02150 [Epilithonimonas hominis]
MILFIYHLQRYRLYKSGNLWS